MDLKIWDKVIIVTGGTKGIGEAISGFLSNAQNEECRGATKNECCHFTAN